jgi:RNA polymerase sigma factor for flagellar operon FliA
VEAGERDIVRPQQQRYQEWDRQRRLEQIQQHLPLVYSAAHRVLGAIPADAVEFGDLVSAGILGLHKALERFDERRGIPFGAFAQPYVRGAMLDEVARHLQIPRGLRRKQARLRQALDALTSRLGREPSDDEIAEELAISPSELDQWYTELNWTTAFSVEELEAAGGIGLEDETVRGNPAAALDAKVRRQALIQALARLSQREQQVLWAYYHEELTLKEIGEILGVGESQVSRIRTRAIAKLREWLAEWRE